MFTDDLIDNPVALRAHLAAVEATGRALARALVIMRDIRTLSLAGFCEKYGDMTQAERAAFVNRTIRDVLATDPARAWLEESEREVSG